MANAKPDDAPRWICPECDCGLHARDLKARDGGALAGVLLECPVCEIGSPLDEWKKTPRIMDTEERNAIDHLWMGFIKMPFGKYCGRELGEIPLRYLDETIAIMPPTWLVRHVIKFVDIAMRHPGADERPSQRTSDAIIMQWQTDLGQSKQTAAASARPTAP